MGGLAWLRGWNAAFTACLALLACGGVTEKPKADEPNGGTGGRPGIGGVIGSTGGRVETGGSVPVGETGGAPASGGGKGSAGELSFGGKGTGSRLCEFPRPRLNSRGEPTGVEECVAGGDHRVSIEECAIQHPREVTCERDAEEELCERDADCTEKPYGECNLHGGGLGCACDYGCRTDTDCADGAVCICGESMGTCVPATCRADADCEEGYQCRSFQDPTSPICTEQRFECQTPADLCNQNADCPPLSAETCVADERGVHRCVFFSCIFG